MNIFILDKKIKNIAKYHNDKHLIKMILESAQMLSAACRISGINEGYKITHKNHPSVEKIYNDISSEIPTLSKTTVYNTLNLFFQKHIVSVLTIDENESRYDYNLKNHVHFKCSKCGSIEDLFIENPLFKNNMIEGNKIDECHIYLKGTCKNCK